MVEAWTREHVEAESVEEAEQIGQEVAQVVGHVVAETSIQQLAGAVSYEGSSRPCACGRRAKFMGYRPRGIGTLCGVVEVRRAYYHCRHCGSGEIPWDVQQGLSRRMWTPGVKALVCRVAARLSYQESCELLGELTPIRVEESSAEFIVAEVGRRVRAREAAEMEQYLSGLVPLPEGRRPDRLYVAMDGSHAHIDGEWHEVKTGVIYEGVADKSGPDESGAKHYVSAQDPAEMFGDRLFVAAAHCGVHRAQEVVVIGDGAAWIWNLAKTHYPGATEIVDYWHACQHIHDLGKALYGEDSPQGQRWAREHCKRLEHHGPVKLLRALKRMRPRTPEAAERVRLETHYFRTNAHRMRYPALRKRGLMIGSGPAEAACKVVVGHRLKRAGMRWKRPGADCVLALRCRVLNRQYDDIRQLAKAA